MTADRVCPDCSGLPDRTTLRPPPCWFFQSDALGLFRSSRPDYIETVSSETRRIYGGLLFRSSRPDYIETTNPHCGSPRTARHCSGLPDRTTLRRIPLPAGQDVAVGHCSGLPDRTTLRRHPSRERARVGCSCEIVPVFQTGLH